METFLKTYREYSKSVKSLDMCLSIHGISFSEFNILDYIYSRNSDIGVTRVELADNLAFSASGITRLLQPMEKIGLVGKKSSDRDARKSLVYITEAGKKIYNDSTVTVNDFLSK
ncbi:MAG: hypothetical protein Kapaf2KO_12940 [Candidatus Kapaibacteriales bacterium]